MALRSDVLEEETTAEWLMDLMAKLGAESDAYHATCVVLMEYGGDAKPPTDDGDDTEETVEGTVEVDGDFESVEIPGDDATIQRDLASLPSVRLRHEEVPSALQAGRFLHVLVNHVLDVSPVTMHREARERRRAAVAVEGTGGLGAAVSPRSLD